MARLECPMDVDYAHEWLLSQGWKKKLGTSPNAPYTKDCEMCYSEKHQHSLGLHDAVNKEFHHQITNSRT